MRLPRKNDPESIAARRDAIRGVVGDEPLALDDEAWSRAQESHTGAAVIPVSVVGPLVVELGAYELEEPEGTLRETGRAEYTWIDDEAALAAFQRLGREEGILPALESSHAIAHACRIAPSMPKEAILMVNLSGRGDKDVISVQAALEGGR